MHVRLVLATVWISLVLSADASDGARRECSWEEAHQPPYSGEAAAEQVICPLADNACRLQLSSSPPSVNLGMQPSHHGPADIRRVSKCRSPGMAMPWPAYTLS